MNCPRISGWRGCTATNEACIAELAALELTTFAALEAAELLTTLAWLAAEDDVSLAVELAILACVSACDAWVTFASLENAAELLVALALDAELTLAVELAVTAWELAELA